MKFLRPHLAGHLIKQDALNGPKGVGIRVPLMQVVFPHCIL